MKKILGLTIAALLVLGLVGGGTWAYFTDPESSTGNTFTAGTLNLIPATEGTVISGTYTIDEDAGGDGLDGNVQFSVLEPGDSGSIEWLLYNDGNIGGAFTVASTFGFGVGTEPEPEIAVVGNDGAGGDLDKYLGVKLKRGVGSTAADARAAATYILGEGGYRPAEDLEAALDGAGVAMAASGPGNDYVVYILEWSIASDVKSEGTDGNMGTAGSTNVDDNVIQGDTMSIDITFTLTQS